jgi:Cu/Ag efflux protein CusF
MMPVWQVVLLVNLALGVGMGVGYASWGRQVKSLEQDLDAARARIERLERELKARAAGAPAGEQQWEARGVVRAIFPGSDMLVITHEEIQGLMPAMTMGFRAASPGIREAVRLGQSIRFTLRGRGRDVAIVAVEKSA